jgi:tetratricopeptide (TPR) repeat protein
METTLEAPFSQLSVESVLLDADLFVKYKSPERAVALLQKAIQRSPRSIPLREKLKEISAAQKNPTEAARQCLALVNLYINREEFEHAYDRLQEAKLLDPRVSVAPGLEAIRRARRPDFAVNRIVEPVTVRTDALLAGNLAMISLFDVIHVIENSNLTGLLLIKSDVKTGNIAFNEGKIADADSGGHNGKVAFREILEINSGSFEFTASDHEFPVVLHVSANTNFLLDLLAEMDTEKMVNDIMDERESPAAETPKKLEDFSDLIE